MTITPSMSSAGQDAHQPSTAVRSRAREAMFHSAGTRRCEDETGTIPCVVFATKSMIPCSSGVRPVAIVVQITGDEP